MEVSADSNSSDKRSSAEFTITGQTRTVSGGERAFFFFFFFFSAAKVACKGFPIRFANLQAIRPYPHVTVVYRSRGAA
jgi:hypothetical protein